MSSYKLPGGGGKKAMILFYSFQHFIPIERGLLFDLWICAILQSHRKYCRWFSNKILGTARNDHRSVVVYIISSVHLHII